MESGSARWEDKQVVGPLGITEVIDTRCSESQMLMFQRMATELIGFLTCKAKTMLSVNNQYIKEQGSG